MAIWDSVASNARIGVHFVTMKLRTRLCAVAALLALLGVPGLSCFVPQQLLGADEERMLPPDGFSMWLEGNVVPSILLQVTEPTKSSAVYRRQR